MLFGPPGFSVGRSICLCGRKKDLSLHKHSGPAGSRGNGRNCEGGKKSNEPNVPAEAMVLVNNQLFIAGPRDAADEKELWGRSNEQIYKEKMALQLEWFKGTHAPYMQVFSKKDGTKLAEKKLPYLPAFDGLIAANGRLYMATQCGSVLCYKGK
jgi:hypothetical protein